MKKVFLSGIALWIMACVLISCSKIAKEQSEWEISPSFGQFRGIEGKVGFIDAPFIAGKANKYMWHFWGDDFDARGDLKVLGFSQKTGEELVIIEALPLSDPLNGAAAHVPSLMALNTDGLWKLDAYVSDKFIGSIVVNAAESP